MFTGTAGVDGVTTGVTGLTGLTGVTEVTGVTGVTGTVVTGTVLLEVSHGFPGGHVVTVTTVVVKFCPGGGLVCCLA